MNCPICGRRKICDKRTKEIWGLNCPAYYFKLIADKINKLGENH